MNYQGGHPLTANILYLQNGDGHIILVISSFAQWSFSALGVQGTILLWCTRSKKLSSCLSSGDMTLCISPLSRRYESGWTAELDTLFSPCEQ